MTHDNAYEALNDDIPELGDSHWAYGTGFTDPMAGVDTTVPGGVDGGDLAAYCLMLGDDALVMSHRLQEWCTHAPELEEEVALANIALDLLGQARLLLARAGQADGSGRDEDTLAFHRGPEEMLNVRLAEIENGDFAHDMARLLIFSTWRLALLDHLTTSRDPVLAAVAAKGVKELTYHRDYAAGWVVRLGDGTPESHRRMRDGLTAVWPLIPELFTTTDLEHRLTTAGVATDPTLLRPEFDTVLSEVLRTATLTPPSRTAGGAGSPMDTGAAGDAEPGRGAGSAVENGASAAGSGRGREGAHTPALARLLDEMQSVARALPGATW